jgi:hypothetical protein
MGPMAGNFSDVRIALGYLAGIIDGEGSISCTSRNMVIRISNTEYSIIQATCECLDLLGVEYIVHEHKRTNHWKDFWIIGIYRLSNFQKLAEVPLRSENKKWALERILANHKGDRMTHNPDPEVLKSLYLAGKTHREIAEEMGFKSHSNVQYWLKKYDLTLNSQDIKKSKERKILKELGLI